MRSDSGIAPVVVFANDWATDPTSKHHLIRLLAARRPALWVETSGMRRPQITQNADLSRIIAKVRKMGGGVRNGAPGLTVLTPPSLPLPTSPLAQRLNATLYAHAIRRSLRTMHAAGDPVLWVYTPTAARYLDRIPHRALVYHCVDRWWAFPEYDTAEMRACHEILCRRADHVFASSVELADDCRAITDRVTYLPHGVDWEHFHRAVSEPLPRPGLMPPAGRPVIGFVGLIESWIDVELIAAIARHRPDADVVLVGAWKVSDAPVAGLANVYSTGRRPFSELPAYLRAFDVALVPFRINELTRAVNPLKLHEYLSAGVPVVSTALPELAPFRTHDAVDIVDDHASFLAAIDARVVNIPDLPARRRISESMRASSWPGRLDTMLQQLDGVL